MNALAHNAIAAALALLLAMPTGWCCVALGHGAPAGEGAPQPSCCRQVPSPAPEHSAPQPADEGGAQCGCSERTAVPEQAVVGADDSGPIAWATSAQPAAQPGGAAVADLPGRAPGGPRLHVLQCVWRC